MGGKGLETVKKLPDVSMRTRGSAVHPFYLGQHAILPKLYNAGRYKQTLRRIGEYAQTMTKTIT
jgi:hypothetical protein